MIKNTPGAIPSFAQSNGDQNQNNRQQNPLNAQEVSPSFLNDPITESLSLEQFLENSLEHSLENSVANSVENSHDFLDLDETQLSSLFIHADEVDSVNSSGEINAAGASVTENRTELLVEEDCADYIVRYLEALGVEYVFGIPGGNIEPFYNALARAEKRGTLKHVTARHESGAVFMAEGYYRETGKLGVVCTTTGPGATNAITGVACAYGNYAPILLITAQTSLATFGRGALQESAGALGANTVAMLDSVTRYNSLISHPQQLLAQLDKAVMHAFGPTPGPVHLSISRDVFTKEFQAHDKAHVRTSLKTFMTIAPNVDELSYLRFLLDTHKSTVILVGNHAKNCADLILSLAELNEWHYVLSPGAKGYLPSNHPLYAGVYGIAGHDKAKIVLENCQLILSFGLECNEINTCSWNPQTICSKRLVQITDNFELLTSPSCSKLKLYATPRLVLEGLLKKIDSKKLELLSLLGFNDARYQLSTSELAPFSTGVLKKPNLNLVHKEKNIQPYVKPQDLLEFLNDMLPSNTIIAMEMGNSFLWGIHYWNFHHNPQAVSNKNLFFIDNGMASMGWAIGAAIGAALANPTVQVLCIVGDGAYLMAAQELTVAIEHELNIIFVVLNDACLGTVKHGQMMAGAEKIAFRLPRVDFSMMAKAQGAKSALIKNLKELRELDPSMFNRKRPILLDVWIDDTQSPPLKTRVDALNTA